MERDGQGRLGVKIGGYPSGVYVDRIDWGVARVVSGSLLVRPHLTSPLFASHSEHLTPT